MGIHFGGGGAGAAGDAGDVTYTPTVGADWPGVPATVQGALDNLAAQWRLNAGSHYFDGADDYMSVTNASSPDLSLTGDFTIEAWIHLGSVVGDNVITSRWDDGVDASKNHIFLYDGGQRLKLFLYDGTFGYQVVYQSDLERLEDNGWQHVAVVYDASSDTASFYVNGRLSASDAAPIDTLQAGTADFRLGANAEGADFFEGHLNCVRVWGDIRTPSEINANMYEILGGPGDNLISEWSLTADGSDPISGYDLTVSGATSVAFVPWLISVDRSTP